MSSQTIFVTKASTDQSVDVHLIQDAGATNPGDPLTGLVFNSAGLVCNYREGGLGAVTALTLITQTVTGAHDPGGFVLLNDTTMPGSYRLDLSDTIVSGTNNQATLVLSGHADLAPHTVNIVLTDMDLYDGSTGGLSILTTIDTNVSDAMGATFVTGTDSLEAIRNQGDAAWQGGPTLSAAGTAVAGSTTTLTEEVGQESPENALEGQLLHIISGTGAPQSKSIESNVFATGVITIIGTWPEDSPDATSVYQVTPNDIDEIIAAPTAADNAAAVWNENTAGHTSAGTFGEQCKIDIDAILADTGQLGNAVGASISADIASVQDDTTLIVADTNELQTDWTNDGRLDAILDLVLADTADMQPKLGAPSTDVSADIAAVKAETALIVADTAEIGTAGIGLTDLGGMSAGMTAEVNAEVVDVLNVDTFAEPGQGSPGATITLAAKINYLYKWTRNRKTSTATEIEYYDSGATVVDQKRTHTDDATTYDQTAISTGA